MNWTLRLFYADGTKEDLYTVTRAEARNSAKWYRTWTEGKKAVIKTKVMKSNV